MSDRAFPEEEVRDDLLDELIEHTQGAIAEPGDPSATESFKVRIVDTETGKDVSEDYVTGLAIEFPQARRGMARLLKRSGRCPVYAPGGMRCPACGKIHDL